MLTVKHVERGGFQSIRECASVSFTPNENIDGGALDAYGILNDDGGAVTSGHCTYGSGQVFVMNESGSTVGNYNLTSQIQVVPQ